MDVHIVYVTYFLQLSKLILTVIIQQQKDHVKLLCTLMHHKLINTTLQLDYRTLLSQPAYIWVILKNFEKHTSVTVTNQKTFKEHIPSLLQ